MGVRWAAFGPSGRGSCRSCGRLARGDFRRATRPQAPWKPHNGFRSSHRLHPLLFFLPERQPLKRFRRNVSQSHRPRSPHADDVDGPRQVEACAIPRGPFPGDAWSRVIPAKVESGALRRRDASARRGVAREPLGRFRGNAELLRLWNLPDLWTLCPRGFRRATRPRAPWKPHNGFHSSHSLRPLLVCFPDMAHVGRARQWPTRHRSACRPKWAASL